MPSHHPPSAAAPFGTRPALEVEDGRGLVRDGEETQKNRWWKESKRQLLISLPMILINLSFYLIPLVSVMFAGHLGELELAASNLANSWATVTGLVLMLGMSGALETLCGQCYGAQQYGMLGIYLQSSFVISMLASVFVSVVWWFTEPIFLLLHQNSSIAKASGLYIKYLVPGVFAYGFIQNLLRFFQTQSVLIIPMACSLISLGLHVGIAYICVHLTGLGYRGAPLAASISLWISLVMLTLYAKFSSRFQLTYTGLSFESLRHVFTNLKLALPSAAMVCLEYWAFEILVILAGLMANSETTTSLIAMCVNTEAIAYMATYGFSAAASTRVSNELGAGNPKNARHAMWVTLTLSISVAVMVVVFLAVGHNVWAGFFTTSSNIIKKFASMTPLLVISIMLDSIQGVFSGVSRGCGWQHLAMCANLATFYLIGMPTACLLAFKFKLYSKGLWIGLICGLSFQAATLFLLAFLKKWTKMQLSLNGYNENAQPPPSPVDQVTIH